MTLQEQLKQFQNTTIERMPQHIMKVFTDGIEALRKEKLQEKALHVGNLFPDMTLYDTNKNSVLISTFQNSEFLILNFYRGGWCPYCNMELREYERLRKDFNAIGVDIIGISAESSDLANTTTHKNALSYPILTDVNAQLMKAIGFVFELDEATKKEYLNFGIDLTKNHGNDRFELPVPAVYVINQKMEIQFVHLEEDYATRLEPTVLLNFLTSKK